MSERQPRIFRLDEVPTQSQTLADEPDFLSGEIDRIVEAEILETKQRKRGSTLGLILRSALGLLFSLWVGLYGWHFIEMLFDASETLGWIGAAAAAIAIGVVAILFYREWRALSRLDDLSDLRADIAKAIADDDREAARLLVRRLIALYRDDPRSAGARAEMESHLDAIIDGPDLLAVAERVLLKSRDAAVRAAILAASKRVSLITTLSPRALVDIVFVGGQAIRLTRRIAEIYGGRPGLLSFLRLGRKVLEHLAITGGMAVTDGVLSQVLGAGLAARLSAKLGEGVLNGILTARIGLVAIAICRPMPFIAESEPRLSELAGGLMRAEDKGARSM